MFILELPHALLYPLTETKRVVSKHGMDGDGQKDAAAYLCCTPERKEKTPPFSVNLTRSLAIYQAAQCVAHHTHQCFQARTTDEHSPDNKA